MDISGCKNEAVIINPLVTHRCQPHDINNWQFTMIYIQEYFLKGLDFQPSISIKKLNPEERLRLKELISVLTSDAPVFEKENILVSFLMALLEECDVNILFDSKAPVEEVLAYIRLNYLTEISLENLEHRFQVNKYQLIREFKSKYNTTPSSYQLQLKISYGKSLLRHDSLLAEIALDSGFYDQAHFSKEFKKAYGITPLKYMKSLSPLMNRRNQKSTISLGRATQLQMTAACLVLLPIVLFQHPVQQIAGLDAKQIVLLLILGIIHTGIAYLIYFSTYVSLSAISVALISYLEPVFGILFGWLILAEKMDLWKAAGGVLILGVMIAGEVFKKPIHHSCDC